MPGSPSAEGDKGTGALARGGGAGAVAGSPFAERDKGPGALARRGGADVVAESPSAERETDPGALARCGSAGAATPGRPSAAGATSPLPCDECLRRTWLLAALAPHIERSHIRRTGPGRLLALGDRALIEALAGSRRRTLVASYERFDPAVARAAIGAARLDAVCRHDSGYPRRLEALPDPPAIVHGGGALARAALDDRDAVAIVGARRCSEYGREVAYALGRGLAAAGVTVVSGMALGIDAASHAGALAAGGPTVAVLAGGADRPYPPSKRGLYRRILAGGAVVSEMPPGFTARRWSFPARNRLIAGLATITIVVEATPRSGSLITAGIACQLQRDVAAVPGHVSSPLAEGTHALLFDGAHLVRDARDVLDLLFGAGMRAPGGRDPEHDALDPPLRELLDAVAGGDDTLAALARAGRDIDETMAGLADLELRGLLRRGAGGRYVRIL